MKLLDDKLFIENNNDIDLLRDEYPLFDSIKFLIEELCSCIENDGADDELMNAFINSLEIYEIVCHKYHIFTLDKKDMYNEFISLLKKKYMN